MQALGNTGNPNNEERKQAEASLKTAEQTPGYTSALLQISGNKCHTISRKFSININHAASIQFGRLITEYWKYDSKEQAMEAYDDNLRESEPNSDWLPIIIPEADK